MYYGYRRRRTGPKKVKNGIKVRAKRGELGRSWLAKEWMEFLQEATYSSSEFTRGRTYARKGQVLSVEIDKGSVVATVQGTAVKPYKMNMTVGTPDIEFWKSFAQMLKEKPAYAATILAGEMPTGMADEMASRGLDLFPTGERDLKITCECDTWTYMCKHAAAASYVLAEEFDRDPLLYLKIRGIDREEFVSMLHTGKPKIVKAAPAPPPVDAGPARKITHIKAWGAFLNMLNYNPPVKPTSSPPQTQTVEERVSVSGGLVPGFCVSGMPVVPDGRTDIPSDPREFWGYRGKSADSYDSALAPAEPAALPKALGRFPMWRGEGQFIDLLEEIYNTASRTGANAYLGIRNPEKGGAAGKKRE